LDFSHFLGRTPVRRRSFLGLVGTVLAVAAAGASAEARPILVFAAASLKTALDVIAGKWQQQSGQAATISYAASSALARQIELGAPADLFISADEAWMDYLEERRLIDPKTRVDLLGNTLVLIAPANTGSETRIAPGFPLAALLGDGRLAMADPAAVPAGRYGKAALTRLGVWDQVAGHVAAAENVRAALLLVARGEAPLGIVYRTDAAAEPGVRIVGTFPADSHPPIVYPMALTVAAEPDAGALANYLRAPEAREVFAAHGFTAPELAR
jgi:molybdate transport system substrate-binding protein